MGGVFKAVANAVGSVIGSVVNAIGKFLSAVAKFVVDNIVEPIMAFLGFKDEDVYNTDIVAVKVFTEDFYAKTKTDLALEYMKEGTDILTYATGYAKTGDSQFGKYYRHGKWEYLDYLPAAQIDAVALAVTSIQDIIENEIGDDIFIRDIIAMVPYDIDWCKYQLQQLYGYDIGEDYLIYDGKYFKYEQAYYNNVANNFNVLLATISSLNAITYHTTTTTLVSTNPDTNEDTINITISAQTVYTRADTGSRIDVTDLIVISSEDKIVEANTTLFGSDITVYSVEEFVQEAEYLTLVVPNHNNTRRYVAKYATASDGKYYYWIYDPSTNVYPDISSPVRKIEGFEMYPIIMLRNHFYNVSDYEKGGNKPATITKERYLDTVDLLNCIGVSLHDLIDGYSNNPDISKLQDAFFMVGISPSDSHWVVSAALYEMFDFIYDELPFTATNSSYAGVFKENPYNAAMAWIPQPVILKPEVIGSIGTCTHSITTNSFVINVYRVVKTTLISGVQKRVESYDSTEMSGTVKTSNHKVIIINDYGNNYPIGTTKTLQSSETHSGKDLVVKKQISATETKTLTMHNFTSFSIIRRGVENGGKSLDADNKNLVIPLPVPVVERLTLIQKSALLSRSVYMVFYAYEHKHIEWYQTKAFGNFLKILSIGITVIVTIFTFGSGTNASMTLSTVLLNVLKSVAIGAALQLALHLITTFVDDIGLKIALSLAATAVAMYAGGVFDNFNGVTAVQLANMPIQAFQMYTNDLAMELQDDVNDFNSAYNRRVEKNKAIMESLSTSVETSDIVELALSSSNDWFAERGGITYSPSQFYDMAIGAYRNYDSMYSGFYDSAIHNFVKNKLTLGMVGD